MIARGLPRRRTLLVAAWALGLAGCSSLPRVPVEVEGGVAWSGRLALSVEGERPQALSARFELEGLARQGRFVLVSPLGTTLLRAQWQPGRAVLSLPDGQRSYPDMDHLTEDALGEPLPVAALFDWLQGRPVAERPSEPQAGGFLQDGWQIDTRGLPEGRMALERRVPLPKLRLRVVFDPPAA